MNTFLNCIFVCLKNHKGYIIIWIIIIFFEYFPLIAKFKCSKLDTWQMFLHVQIIQTWRVDSPYFFQMFFFLQTVHHSLWKLKILTLMTIKEKGLEPMKIVYITNLSTFGSNVLLTLKIMSFENVVSIKVVHIYVIKGIYNIKSICNQNIFIFNMKR